MRRYETSCNPLSGRGGTGLWIVCVRGASLLSVCPKGASLWTACPQWQWSFGAKQSVWLCKLSNSMLIDIHACTMIDSNWSRVDPPVKTNVEAD